MNMNVHINVSNNLSAFYMELLKISIENAKQMLQSTETAQPA